MKEKEKEKEKENIGTIFERILTSLLALVVWAFVTAVVIGMSTMVLTHYHIALPEGFSLVEAIGTCGVVAAILYIESVWR